MLDGDGGATCGHDVGAGLGYRDEAVLDPLLGGSPEILALLISYLLLICSATFAQCS